jgi:predicted ATPase
MVEEIERWYSRQGHHVALARAYPAEGYLAYAPAVEWLRSEALQTSVRSVEDVWLAELARLMPELRAEHPDLPEPPAASSTEQRQRLFHAIARALSACGRPVLLGLDDAQWSDRETLEFLHFLARSDHGSPLLVLLTVRPEELDADHPVDVLARGLQRLGVLTSFELGPLDTTQVGELARRMRGRETPQDQAAALHRATGGNPLFVVETVRDERSGSRTGPAAASGSTTPSRVQAVIERRLGQLSPDAREIVALAGMLGREFTHELLRRASDWDEARLVEVLDELWRRRIVRAHGTAAYDFVHDRIREVAAGLVGPARCSRPPPEDRDGARGPPRRRPGCRERPHRHPPRRGGRTAGGAGPLPARRCPRPAGVRAGPWRRPASPGAAAAGRTARRLGA